MAIALGIGVTMTASQQQNVAAFNDQNTGSYNNHFHGNTASDGSFDYNTGFTTNTGDVHANYGYNSNSGNTHYNLNDKGN